MPFPLNTISVTTLTSDTQSPAEARPTLLQFVETLNDVIETANTAQGVVVTANTGRISSNLVPATIQITGPLIFAPSDGIVNIKNILHLPFLTKEQILAIDNPDIGDVVFCSNVALPDTVIGNITIPGARGPGIAFFRGNADGLSTGTSHWYCYSFEDNGFNLA